MESFWSVFSHIWAEYGEILLISPNSVQMQENTDQSNSEYGHFLGSDLLSVKRSIQIKLFIKLVQKQEEIVANRNINFMSLATKVSCMNREKCKLWRMTAKMDCVYFQFQSNQFNWLWFPYGWDIALKVGLLFALKNSWLYLLQWKSFKNAEKCFLIHLKNSFLS